VVYDYQGNALSNAFNCAGDSLQTVYDALGAAIHLYPIDNNTDDIVLADVAEYYQDRVETVTTAVNRNNSRKVSFILLADTHGSWNDNNSQNIIRYLLKYSKADKVFWLGDMVAQSWQQESFAQFDSYFAPLVPVSNQVYMTIGNHDTYGVTDLGYLHDSVLAEKDNLHGDTANFYYYFDDIDRKIRYLVLNTSDAVTDDYVSDAQVEWIRSSVQELPADWFVASFAHHPISGGLDSSSRSAEIVSALETTQATVIGHFCGHLHADRYIRIDDRLHEVSIDKDYSNAPGTTPDRVSGTYTEQSVSIVTVDLDKRKVHVDKIGAGVEMHYEF
jgi:hypothetical protein